LFLTAVEESDLGRRALAGDLTARNELVDRNRPYVLSRARRYSAVCRDDDLVQSGYLGLIEAANRFDPDAYPGTRFINIASDYVHKYMVQYLYDRNIVRIPASQRLRERHPPTTQSNRRKREWAVHCATTALKRTHSLDLGPFIDVQESDDATPDLSDDIDELRKAIMLTLTPIEAEVIRSRFGIDGVRKTLKTLGIQFGYTKANISLIEHRAIGKLREKLRSVQCPSPRSRSAIS